MIKGSKVLTYAAVLLLLAGVFTATALGAQGQGARAGDCDQTCDQTKLKIQDPTTCTQDCYVDCDGTPDRLRDGSCRL